MFSTPLLTQAESSLNNKPVDDMTELDMKDLLNLKVTSVSKKAQALSDAPSAVFVISQDDIRRTGVTSIPEALRMAPGIDVARINANKWAITSRGFNSNFGNKLLVLIDGRSVYTPSFSGVYWDAQDTMIEDIERIEIIRGPGATLWGANAVNGVINIITKTAENTQGGLLVGGGGDRETGFGGLRYGMKLGKDTHARAYIKGFERDNFILQPNDSENGGDNWSRVQGGFRADSRLTDKDELTLQGDLYRSSYNQIATTPLFNPPFSKTVGDSGKNEGWNVTSRLRHKSSSTSEYNLQFYYDHTRRQDVYIEQQLDTLDVDFQHNFELTDNQNAIWGLGYRANMDQFGGTTLIKMVPPRRNTQLFSAFVQDEMELIDNSLWLTIGSKFEHNDYTGFEGQPSARLMWAPTSRQRLWGAFSRSVRTPSRGEQDSEAHLGAFPGPPIPQLGGISLPISPFLNGSRQFQAEVQLSYELGYRFAFSDKASIDLTAFYSDYDKLRGSTRGAPVLETSPQPHIDIPLMLNNQTRASTHGFEAVAMWQMTDWLRWDLNYSFLKTAFDEPITTGISPQHKMSVRAVVNPVDKVSLDFWLRYNGTATALQPIRTLQDSVRVIPDYVSLDVRLAWKPHPAVELSLVGQNLLDDSRLEYIDETFITPTEIPRSFYGKVAFEF
jgi:iron complex outermembrane receptor protein